MTRRRSRSFWAGFALVLITFAGLARSATDVDGSSTLSFGVGGLFAVLMAWSASAASARGASRRGIVTAFSAPALGALWLAVWMLVQTAHAQQRSVLEVLGLQSRPAAASAEGREPIGVFFAADPATSILVAVVIAVGLWCAVLGPVLRKRRGTSTLKTTRDAVMPFAVLATSYLLLAEPLAALIAAISAWWLLRYLRRDGTPRVAPTEPPPAAA